MEWTEAEVLRKCRPRICRDLQLIELLNILFADGFITSVERQIIKGEKTEYERNDKFLDILEAKGSAAFHALFSALATTQQHTIADYLKKSQDDIDDNAHPSPKKLKISDLPSVKESLKKSYLERFRKVNPFSLPFTFDIENTWVSLALREDRQRSKATQDHVELLNTAFTKAKMLIIEGNPATGKTSLMRRLAYEWACGGEELAHYELVVYAEFREVRERKFISITELAVGYQSAFLEAEECTELGRLITDKEFCKKHRVLILLDGYDESSLSKQCHELHNYLSKSIIDRFFLHNIVLTTRPGYLSKYRGQEGRFIFADVLGFPTKQQKQRYISNHFSAKEVGSQKNIEAVHQLLTNNKKLKKLAATPLFLTFICLVHERIIDGTLVELYFNIIWWLLDRHQKDFPDRDVPELFGFLQDSECDKFQIIQDNFIQFPQIQMLGEMGLHKLKQNAFSLSDLNKFKVDLIVQKVGLLRREEQRSDSLHITAQFLFPHRTIQEFLAAVAFLNYDSMRNITSLQIRKKAIFHRKIDNEYNMKKVDEFEKFLWRTACKMPMTQARFFEKFKTLNIDLNFFISSLEISVQQLVQMLQKCSNVEQLALYSTLSNSSINNELIDLSNMTNCVSFYFLKDDAASFPYFSQRKPPEITKTLLKNGTLLLPKTKLTLVFKETHFRSSALFVRTMKNLSNDLLFDSKFELQRVEVHSMLMKNQSLLGHHSREGFLCLKKLPQKYLMIRA